LGRHGRYLPTVAWLTSMPSLSSSPWMRGSAPKRILLAHLADQITDLAVHAGPSQVTCPPPPVEAEAFAMPADHGGYQGCRGRRRPGWCLDDDWERRRHCSLTSLDKPIEIGANLVSPATMPRSRWPRLQSLSNCSRKLVKHIGRCQLVARVRLGSVRGPCA
jgi:hypothetical protein